MSGPNYFWLGPPCQFHPELKIPGISEKDLGGRVLALPSETSPAEFWDQTMPMLLNVHQRLQQQAVLSKKMDFQGFLVQGIQVTWIFASEQLAVVNTKLFQAERKIQALEARIAKLEAH